jgi:hypothetical protein
MTRPTKKLPTCRKGCPNISVNWITNQERCGPFGFTRPLPKKGVPRWCPLRKKRRK